MQIKTSFYNFKGEKTTVGNKPLVLKVSNLIFMWQVFLFQKFKNGSFLMGGLKSGCKPTVRIL